MQITESFLASAPTNPKPIESMQDSKNSEHEHGFCGVFEQLAERDGLSERAGESELDQSIDADGFDQAAEDSDKGSSPDLAAKADDDSAENKNALDKLTFGNGRNDTLKLDNISHNENEKSGSSFNISDTNSRRTKDPQPSLNSDVNPVLGQINGDDRGLNADGKIDHIGPRNPSAIEAVMVDRMRFEGVGKSEFIMPPSTIARQVPQAEMAETSNLGARDLVKQPQANPAVLLSQSTGQNGSVVNDATQNLTKTEHITSSEPAAKTIEYGRDTPLLRQPNALMASDSKIGLASISDAVPRRGANQTEDRPSFRSATIESEVRSAPQNVTQAPNPVGQSVISGMPENLRPVSKGEDVAKINFEHVPEMRQDTRIGSPSTVAPPLARPEMSQAIIRQMTDAVRAQVTAEKTVEIALRPAELGRVRIALSPADAGMIVTVSAERAETLELMRRNIDDLARSFAEMGHENLSFSFEQDGAFDHKDDQPMRAELADETASSDIASELDTQTPMPVLQTQNTGVDILV
jgi:hypothetical protein